MVDKGSDPGRLPASPWPVLKSYDQQHLLRIAMPLGGIGTGTVSLGGRGNLQDWEVVNRPAKGFTPKNTFFALFAQEEGNPAVTRALEGPLDPSQYEGAQGCSVPNHNLPRFRSCQFEAAYPLAQVTLSDPDVPVSVRLEAFNPLVPTNADDSGIPIAVLRFLVANRTQKVVKASICASLQNFIGADGSDPKVDWAGRATFDHKFHQNRNEYKENHQLHGIYMTSKGLDHCAETWGSLALVLAGKHHEGISYRTLWPDLSWGDSLLDFWDDFSLDGQLDQRESGLPNSRRPVRLGRLKYGLAVCQFRPRAWCISHLNLLVGLALP